MEQITVYGLLELVAELLPNVANDRPKAAQLLKATAAAVDNARIHGSDYVGVNDWATIDQIMLSELHTLRQNRKLAKEQANTAPANAQGDERAFIKGPGDEQDTALDGTQIEPSGTARFGNKDGGPEVRAEGSEAPYTTHLDAPFEAASPQGEGKIDPIDVSRPDFTATAQPSENPPVSPLPGPVVDLPPVAPPRAPERIE